MGTQAMARDLSKSRNGPERASVLIIVLGILVALVIIGTTFVTLQRIESMTARNYYEATQADIFAQAAVQYSLNFLRRSPLATSGRAWHCIDPLWAPYTDYRASQTFNLVDGKTQAEVKFKFTDAAGRLNLNGNIGNVQTVLQTLLQRLNLTGGDAAGIVAKLPLNSLDDLPALLTNKYDDFRVLRDHVTICAWSDDDAVTPGTALQAAARSPVNVNTASYPVLVAAMTPALTESVADTLAQRIISYRSGEPVGSEDYKDGDENPIQNWTEFSGVVASSGLTADQQLTALGAFIPDGLHSRILREFNHLSAKGKDEVGACGTELCFHSGGYFHLDLLVNIVSPGTGQTLVSRRVQAVVKSHEVWKLATQADFVAGTISTNTVTTGDGSVTYKTLSAYPEATWAQSAPTEPAAPGAFAFGGYLGLVERRAARTATEVTNSSVFIASFTKGLDADRAIGTATKTRGGTVKGINAQNPLQYNSIVSQPLTDSSDLFAEGVRLAMPSTDFPNGKKITFPSANFYTLSDNRSEKGTVEMWVKLNFDPATDTQTHTLFKLQGPTLRVGTTDMERYISLEIDDDTLTLWIEAGAGDWLNNDGDVNPALFDEDDELTQVTGMSATWNIRSAAAPGPLVKGQWNTIAATWNNNQADTNYDGTPDVRGFQAILYVNGQRVGQYQNLLTRPVIGGISADATFGPADVFMDEIKYRQEVLGNVNPDNTARYPQGRYDNRGTLTYTSPWRSIGDNVALGSIAWSESLPQSSIITGADITSRVQIDDNMDGTADQTSAVIGTGTAAGANGDGNSIGLRSAAGMDGAQVRFIATFVPGTPVAAQNGLLRQTPILDDVTLTILGDWELVCWKDVPVAE